MTGAIASKPTGTGQSATAHLPELLAPAGDWDCVRAAVENGADYLDAFLHHVANDPSAADLTADGDARPDATRRRGPTRTSSVPRIPSE